MIKHLVNKVHLKRSLSIWMGVIYLTTHVVLAELAQANVWSERPIQMAALPAPLVSPLPSLKKSLPVSAPSFSKQPFLNDVPHDAVRIKEVHLAKKDQANDAIVFILQDIHQNQEAQINMKAVIEKMNPDVVGLEGAFGEMDFSLHRRLPEWPTTEQVALDLLKKGYFSGPLVAGMNPAVTSDFVGVDDPVLYKKNVEAYRQTLDGREEIEKEISKKENMLKTKKALVFNSHLKELDSLLNQYRAGGISLSDYLKALSSKTDDIHPTLLVFLEAVSMEENINQAQVERERNHLLRKLTKRLTKDEVSDLMAMSFAYRANRVTYADYYRYLKNQIEQAGLSLTQYKAFDDYIRYVLLSENIAYEKLQKALSNLENELFEAAIQTNEERTLLDQGEYLFLTRRLVRFEMTPEEWERYKKIFHFQFSIFNQFSSRDFQTGDSLKINHQKLIENGKLKMENPSFLAFYEAAEARNHALIHNLLKHGRGRTFLVAGGFHTPGLTSLLKKKEISYVVLTPKITKIDGAGSAYLSVFARESTPIEKLFEGDRLSVAPITALSPRPVIDPKQTPRVAAAWLMFFGALLLLHNTAGRLSAFQLVLNAALQAGVLAALPAMSFVRGGILNLVTATNPPSTLRVAFASGSAAGPSIEVDRQSIEFKTEEKKEFSLGTRDWMETILTMGFVFPSLWSAAVIIGLNSHNALLVAYVLSQVFFVVVFHFNGVTRPQENGPPVYKNFSSWLDRFSTWSALAVIGLVIHLPVLSLFYFPSFSFFTAGVALMAAGALHRLYNFTLQQKQVKGLRKLLVRAGLSFAVQEGWDEHLIGQYPPSELEPYGIDVTKSADINYRDAQEQLNFHSDELTRLAETIGGSLVQNNEPLVHWYLWNQLQLYRDQVRRFHLILKKQAARAVLTRRQYYPELFHGLFKYPSADCGLCKIIVNAMWKGFRESGKGLLGEALVSLGFPMQAREGKSDQVLEHYTLVFGYYENSPLAPLAPDLIIADFNSKQLNPQRSDVLTVLPADEYWERMFLLFSEREEAPGVLEEDQLTKIYKGLREIIFTQLPLPTATWGLTELFTTVVLNGWFKRGIPKDEIPIRVAPWFEFVVVMVLGAVFFFVFYAVLGFEPAQLAQAALGAGAGAVLSAFVLHGKKIIKGPVKLFLIGLVSYGPALSLPFLISFSPLPIFALLHLATLLIIVTLWSLWSHQLYNHWAKKYGWPTATWGKSSDGPHFPSTIQEEGWDLARIGEDLPMDLKVYGIDPSISMSQNYFIFQLKIRVMLLTLGEFAFNIGAKLMQAYKGKKFDPQFLLDQFTPHMDDIRRFQLIFKRLAAGLILTDAQSRPVAFHRIFFYPTADCGMCDFVAGSMVSGLKKPGLELLQVLLAPGGVEGMGDLASEDGLVDHQVQVFGAAADSILMEEPIVVDWNSEQLNGNRLTVQTQEEYQGSFIWHLLHRWDVPGIKSEQELAKVYHELREKILNELPPNPAPWEGSSGTLSLWYGVAGLFGIPNKWIPWIGAVGEGTLVYLTGVTFGWTLPVFLSVLASIFILKLIVGFVVWDTETNQWRPVIPLVSERGPPWTWRQYLSSTAKAATSLFVFVPFFFPPVFGTVAPAYLLLLAVLPHLVANSRPFSRSEHESNSNLSDPDEEPEESTVDIPSKKKRILVLLTLLLLIAYVSYGFIVRSLFHEAIVMVPILILLVAFLLEAVGGPIGVTAQELWKNAYKGKGWRSIDGQLILRRSLMVFFYAPYSLVFAVNWMMPIFLQMMLGIPFYITPFVQQLFVNPILVHPTNYYIWKQWINKRSEDETIDEMREKLVDFSFAAFWHWTFVHILAQFLILNGYSIIGFVILGTFGFAWSIITATILNSHRKVRPQGKIAQLISGAKKILNALDSWIFWGWIGTLFVQYEALLKKLHYSAFFRFYTGSSLFYVFGASAARLTALASLSFVLGFSWTFVVLLVLATWLAYGLRNFVPMLRYDSKNKPALQALHHPPVELVEAKATRSAQVEKASLWERSVKRPLWELIFLPLPALLFAPFIGVHVAVWLLAVYFVRFHEWREKETRGPPAGWWDLSWVRVPVRIVGAAIIIYLSLLLPPLFFTSYFPQLFLGLSIGVFAHGFWNLVVPAAWGLTLPFWHNTIVIYFGHLRRLMDKAGTNPTDLTSSDVDTILNDINILETKSLEQGIQVLNGFYKANPHVFQPSHLIRLFGIYSVSPHIRNPVFLLNDSFSHLIHALSNDEAIHQALTPKDLESIAAFLLSSHFFVRQSALHILVQASLVRHKKSRFSPDVLIKISEMVARHPHGIQHRYGKKFSRFIKRLLNQVDLTQKQRIEVVVHLLNGRNKLFESTFDPSGVTFRDQIDRIGSHGDVKEFAARLANLAYEVALGAQGKLALHVQNFIRDSDYYMDSRHSPHQIAELLRGANSIIQVHLLLSYLQSLGLNQDQAKWFIDTLHFFLLEPRTTKSLVDSFGALLEQPVEQVQEPYVLATFKMGRDTMRRLLLSSNNHPGLAFFQDLVGLELDKPARRRLITFVSVFETILLASKQKVQTAVSSEPVELYRWQLTQWGREDSHLNKILIPNRFKLVVQPAGAVHINRPNDNGPVFFSFSLESVLIVGILMASIDGFFLAGLFFSVLVGVFLRWRFARKKDKRHLARPASSVEEIAGAVQTRELTRVGFGRAGFISANQTDRPAPPAVETGLDEGRLHLPPIPLQRERLGESLQRRRRVLGSA